MLADRLQRIAAARVGSGDRLVAVGVQRCVVGQRLGQLPALGTWDFREIAVRRQRLAKAIDECLRAEEELVFELFPGAGLADAVMDEPAVGRHCRAFGIGEGRQQPVATQPLRTAGITDGRAVAAPGPILGCRDHVRTNRVQHDIPRQLFQIGVPLHDDRLVPSLEHMTTAPMQVVEALRIDAVQLAHSFRQIPVRGLHQKVVVVGHQTVGVPPPVEPLADLREQVEKGLPICVTPIDVLAAIAAGGDVVEGARKLDAQRT